MDVISTNKHQNNTNFAPIIIKYPNYHLIQKMQNIGLQSFKAVF